MTSEIQNIKQRFEIIGNSAGLDRAIEKAVRVAPTDITVLVTGESGVGKESFPKIIHQLSHRKHNKFIAVNCGAIPEGTIDSELFGHEKGAFTGATSTRSGYFEVADGGTIFLDEVGELPIASQARLLRVLENGEIIIIENQELKSIKPFPKQKQRPCVFEYIYFARPDSIIKNISCLRCQWQKANVDVTGV